MLEIPRLPQSEGGPELGESLDIQATPQSLEDATKARSHKGSEP